MRGGVRLADEWAVVLGALRRLALEAEHVGWPDVAAILRSLGQPVRLELLLAFPSQRSDERLGAQRAGCAGRRTGPS